MNDGRSASTPLLERWERDRARGAGEWCQAGGERPDVRDETGDTNPGARTPGTSPSAERSGAKAATRGSIRAASGFAAQAWQWLDALTWSARSAWATGATA